MRKKSKKKKGQKGENKKTYGNLPKSEVREIVQIQFHYQVGHFVAVKKGVVDPDYGIEMGGWKGKIYDIKNGADPLLSIEWDDETLNKMPNSIIKACKKDNLDHATMSLFASEVEPVMGSEKKESNKTLLTTMTKEIYMLARITYELYDKEKMQHVFSKLRCMEYDSIQDRWVWLYEAEAKKLKFRGSYHEIPKEKRPIILGVFHAKNDNEMFLNINSFERATKAILFFNKYFPRDVAKVNDITILNKVFESFDGNLFKHEEYFDQAPIKIIDTEKIFNELMETVCSINDPMEKMKSALRLLDNKSKEPLAEVERFLIYFYEEGIPSLEATLKTRETIALEHWKGNKDYSFSDLYQKIVPKMPPLNLK